jgi:glycerol-3-phosphate dehydrogenase
VTAAARAGAVVANYLRVVGLDPAPGTVSRVQLEGRGGEGRIGLRCRVVVNATGPWVDTIRKMEDPGCRPVARLSKGVHVVIQPESEWLAALAISLHDDRHLYAVPCEGTVFLGPTDTEYLGDPGRVAPGPADVSSLLDAASEFLAPKALLPKRVISAFAGLRVLPLGQEAAPSASREHLVSVGSGGVVSVAGGKLTTHRQIALDALGHLPAGIRPRKLAPSDEPLPGAYPRSYRDLASQLDPSTLDHLLHLYGGEAEDLLAYASLHENALERITPEASDVWAQVYHAVSNDWALTVDDIVHRRTTLGLRGRASSPVRARISSALMPTGPIPGTEPSTAEALRARQVLLPG